MTDNSNGEKQKTCDISQILDNIEKVSLLKEMKSLVGDARFYEMFPEYKALEPLIVSALEKQREWLRQAAHRCSFKTELEWLED